MRRRLFLGTGLAGAAALLLPHDITGNDGSNRILRRLNALRRGMDLPGLHLHATLSDMARLQVLHMHRLGRATHAGPGGTNPSARGRQAGYGGLILGETLAEGRDDPGAVLEAWLAHEGPREVLLDPLAREAGLFGAEDAARATRWDLVLGA